MVQVSDEIVLEWALVLCMQNVVQSMEQWAYSPSQKEQWRAQVMGEWLVGVTLHLLDQVVTHLITLGDHWKEGKNGKFRLNRRNVLRFLALFV